MNRKATLIGDITYRILIQSQAERPQSKIWSFGKTQKKILLFQLNIRTRTAQLTMIGEMNVGYSIAISARTAQLHK